MGHAESPVLSIIRGAIRDKVGLSRQRVNVPTKLCERYVLAHGDTVDHCVKVAPGKVNNSLALLSLIYVSRMFHSRGIVQSNTFVPVGTSYVSNATCAPI